MIAAAQAQLRQHERQPGRVDLDAGRCFASWGALEAHLAGWMHEVADTRVHGTTGEAPIARFEREERQALRPLNSRPPFRQLRIPSEGGQWFQRNADTDSDASRTVIPIDAGQP